MVLRCVICDGETTPPEDAIVFGFGAHRLAIHVADPCYRYMQRVQRRIGKAVALEMVALRQDIELEKQSGRKQ